MATLIEWNGKETEIRPRHAEQGFTRGELEKLLEGLVEIMSLDDGRLMVTGARGPVNIKATKLRQSGSTTAGLAIVGSVVVGCPGEIL